MVEGWPVHDAVKKGFPQVLALLLDRRPDMLNRENATGTTPYLSLQPAMKNRGAR
jgi:hypothetical protein